MQKHTSFDKRFLTMLTTISLGTRLPLSMKLCACLPSGVPSSTSARKRSPAEMCTTPNCTMSCVLAHRTHDCEVTGHADMLNRGLAGGVTWQRRKRAGESSDGDISVICRMGGQLS